ncbi:hypothetical protein FA13DRAFT_998416 [Coprinellus micaceus]|uniref:Uncharacterized protein n=1 Tax=Coprinellus micaceus TaxID=71717 RepID=A0A4Y7SYE3_COPMI|nr:hypothetical protein FA13DRAFT_998416 [Coprinellus micaceus]
MSGISPRRIRSKTAELTEFLRTGSSSSRHPDNDVSTASQATAYTLDAPSTSSHGATLTKKKSSKIPFLGISRKKSHPAGSDADSNSMRYSTDVGEHPAGTTGNDRRYTVELPDSLHPPRPGTSLAPPTPVKATLGSKLAAHFQPRARKLSSLGKKPVVDSTTASTSNSNTLAVPEASPRGASLDSGSSDGRSPTPRAQPTITVSLSPENLDEYKDLFTLPRQKKTPKPISPETTPRQSNTPESSEESAGSKRTTTSPIPLQGQSGLPRRGSAPATALDPSRHKTSRSTPPDQPPKPPPKPSKKPSAVEKARSSQEGSSTPRSSDGRDSTRSSLSDKLTVASPIQRRVSVTPSTPAADYSAQQRLRMRQQMQAQTPVPVPEKRRTPPDLPLPSPPGSPQTPASAPPMSRTSSSSSIPKSRPLSSRPRANTGGSISSIAGSPLSQSMLPNDLQSATPPRSLPERQPNLPTPSPEVDISTATPSQLLEALAARDKQYEELTNLVNALTEKHIVEKAALEKKISQLERENSKKDNQIKGLMWLVNNGKNPPATDFPPNLDLPSLPPPTSPLESPKVTTRLPFGRRALHLSDDSGAESYVTSGAESIRTSETSYSESSVRRSKGRRPFMLGDSSYAFYRAAVGKRVSPPNSLAPDSALPELPSKRSSVSGSLSPSSSTSSLLAPSPSLTVSSLSAIPEAPSSYRSASDQEDRRAMRATHRMSGSSMASSSTAASSAYAANIKRSRPPSIAQVLENSPNMDDVLEKLRPFQPSS